MGDRFIKADSGLFTFSDLNESKKQNIHVSTKVTIDQSEGRHGTLVRQLLKMLGEFRTTCYI